jgi:glutamate 5-kinase
MRSGIPLVIASGRKKSVLGDVLAGQEEGTLFVPKTGRLQGRKRWIAFFHHPKGALYVDAGAKKALREDGKSLLPPGVARCEGEFAAGEVVRLCDWTGQNSRAGLVIITRLR